MRVLVIDTATARPGVALAGDAGECEVALPPGRRASEALLPAVAALLAGAGLGLSGIDRLGALAGPGSFTGIRVGLATAWGICRATGIGLETPSSLEALAETARNRGERVVRPALNAERGEFYMGEYDLSRDRAREISPARVVAASRIVDSPSGHGPFVRLDGGPGSDVSPALAAARAIARSPGALTDRPAARYVRPSPAEEFRVRPAT
jgi:tRNA threonylcarbamoyladenosine biosynthesis protein TsaB